VAADTVGFIRELPHELVAAFQSTLTEAREATLLLHVVDASDPRRDEHIAQVDAVLQEIGAQEIPQIILYNKIDRLQTQPRVDRDADGRSEGAAEDGALELEVELPDVELLELARRPGVQIIEVQGAAPPCEPESAYL